MIFNYKLNDAEDTEFIRVHRLSFQEETGESCFEQPVKYFRWLERMYLQMETLNETNRMLSNLDAPFRGWQ